MEINCPKCGRENWLENQSRCFSCGAVLRRCTDCTRYKRDEHYCSVTKDEIGLFESEKPGPLATSANCQSYDPQPRMFPKITRPAEGLTSQKSPASAQPR